MISKEFCRAFNDIALAVCFMCSVTSVRSAVDEAGGTAPTRAAEVQAEYDQVVIGCRKLPPDRDRECVEEAKKKYGELLRRAS
jgi:hypothetical protein